MNPVDPKSPANGSTRTRLRVEGMTCQNCVRHVREALQGVEHVSAAEVELDRNAATVRWTNASSARPEELVRAVRAAGFDAAVSSEEESNDTERLPVDLRLWTAVACTVPLMLGEWVFGWHVETWFRWLSFALATIVQAWSGGAYMAGAWRQLKQRRANMDTLVALGSSTAYGLSVFLLLSGAPGHLYFMEAAAILTVIGVGHWLESRTSARAAGAVRALMKLAPDTALRQEPDGSERTVPVSELRLNDAVIIRPGDRIPADGAVIEGDSSVDESMLTGESMPVEKALHDRLYTGTINLNGRVLMLVTSTGEETALARILDSVKRAQGSRASVQRLADKISSVFVPVVVVIALMTGIFWMFFHAQALALHERLGFHLWTTHLPETAWVAALVNLAAVLIIACPCAMGLATPVAIMAGTNAAARRGILIRDGIALEVAGRIDTLVFDKTGTLTEGKPALERYETYAGEPTRPQIDELALAVSLARHSNHPLSRAISGLGNPPMEITRWREKRGHGVEADCRINPFDDRPAAVRLGSLRWLEENGVECDRGREFIHEWAGQGASLVGLSVDSWLMAVFAIRDQIKPGTAEMLAELKEQGFELHMVTGDHAATARSVAAAIGIPPQNVKAESAPDDKPKQIARLQQSGRSVAFVGDGINDAPALEQANLGIAVCHANDIARESADVLLLNSDVQSIPRTLELARATLAKIRQNLFWAFFYNIAAIPLAALGFLSPVVCAVAMGASDLIVVGNAMLLLTGRPVNSHRLKKRALKAINME